MFVKKILVALCMTVGLSLAPAVAYAADPVIPVDACPPGVVVDSALCKAAQGKDTLFGPGGIWNRILNAITFGVGAIAVIVIIIGAVRYGLSAGDQSAVTGAKNTIIYALVALIVAVMANALVNFVLTNI